MTGYVKVLSNMTGSKNGKMMVTKDKLYREREGRTKKKRKNN